MKTKLTLQTLMIGWLCACNMPTQEEPSITRSEPLPPSQPQEPEPKDFNQVGNTLYPKSSQTAIEKAIRHSWDFASECYRNYPLNPAVKYPKFRGMEEAWPRSESMGTLTIELPPGETIIDRPLYWPANIAMRGAGGAFDGSVLRFRGAGRLCVLGDMVAECGPVNMHGKTISGVYFVAEKSIGCVELWGVQQNLRITNCHFNTLGNPNMIQIRHEHVMNQKAGITPLGRVYHHRENGGTTHCKEIMITNCQFEYDDQGGQGIHLIAPKRCTISDNTFIYGDLGIGATEAADLHINNNKFVGRARVPAVIETEAAPNNRIHFQGNSMAECEHGAWFFGPSTEGTSDATNTFRGSSSKEAVTIKPRGARLPFSSGVFKKGKVVG